MVILHVFVQLKPEGVAPFMAATLAYGNQTKQEGGNLRLEAVQQADDPTHFMLIEIYKDESARDAHFQMSHFEEWHATIQPLLSDPLTSVTYQPLFPSPGSWFG